MTGADISANGHDGAPGVGGHDDVPAVLGVDVEPEAGWLVVVQEEGGAVLTGATSEKTRLFWKFLFNRDATTPLFSKKKESSWWYRESMIQHYTSYYTWRHWLQFGQWGVTNVGVHSSLLTPWSVMSASVTPQPSPAWQMEHTESIDFEITPVTSRDQAQLSTQRKGKQPPYCVRGLKILF